MPSMFDPVILDTEHVKIRPLNSVSWQKLADGLLYEDSFHAKSWGIKTPEDIGPYRTDTLHFIPETSFTLFESQKGHLPVQL
jgi:hypothetical protein